MKHIARKRFGQHFLTDAGIIGSIVEAINPQRSDAMVEIGPGLAALTQPLMAQLDQLAVIELDRDLAARLRDNAALEVIEADVLTVDLRNDKRPVLRLAPFALNEHRKAQGIDVSGSEL